MILVLVSRMCASMSESTERRLDIALGGSSRSSVSVAAEVEKAESAEEEDSVRLWPDPWLGKERWEGERARSEGGGVCEAKGSASSRSVELAIPIPRARRPGTIVELDARCRLEFGEPRAMLPGRLTLRERASPPWFEGSSSSSADSSSNRDNKLVRTVSAELPSLIEFDRLPSPSNPDPEPEAEPVEEEDARETSGVMMRVEFLPFQRTDRPVPGAERSLRMERTEELLEGVLRSPLCAPTLATPGFTRGVGEGVDVSRATDSEEEEVLGGSIADVVVGDVDDVLG